MAKIAGPNGYYSVTFQAFDEKKPLLSINSNSRMAIASNYKWYVLKAIIEEINAGRLSWNSPVIVSNTFKSLFNMYNPRALYRATEGSIYSVKSVAQKMMWFSDNSATDHLINLLGRSKIHDAMIGYNSFLELNNPILLTMDLWRLRALNKSDPESLREYQTLTPRQKIGFVRDMRETYPLTKTYNLLMFGDKSLSIPRWDADPRDIRQIEWFASTSDLCRTGERIIEYAREDNTIKEVLAFHPYSHSQMSFIAAKDGSESGVASMTVLMKTKKGNWACLSMAVNNPVNDSVHPAWAYYRKVFKFAADLYTFGR